MMRASFSTCSGLSWSYDPWGNRTDQTVTGGSCGTFHDTVTTANQFMGSPYTYDVSGNMTHDASHSYFYDAENRLIQVDGTLGTCSTATACYLYDFATGQRIEKIIGTAATSYFRDLSGNTIAEWGPGCGSSCWTKLYAYLNGGLLAEYWNSTTYFVHKDHLGSTRLVTAYPTPSIAECDDYLPFGEGVSCGVNTLTTHKFTGKERDGESGLDNFGARYNSSSLGRFMSPDWGAKIMPVPYAKLDNPQSLNLYAYVGNNPLSKRDPDGHYQCSGTAEQCAAVKAGLAAIKVADKNLKAGTSGKALLDKTLKFYGAANTDNGVKINFNNADPNALGSTSTDHGVTTISFGANALTPLGATGKAETVAHEGTHGVDQKKEGRMPHTLWQFYDTEYHSYQSESAVDKGLGAANETDEHPVWFSGITPQQRTTNITKDAYSNACFDVGGCQ